MKKKYLLFVLLIVLSAAMLTAGCALAASSGNEGSWSWTLDDEGTLTISGTGEISRTWPDNSLLQSVIIEEGITGIGSYTFYESSNMTNITLPESLTSIGYEAFTYCSSLTSLTLPDNITAVEWEAFGGYDGIVYANIDAITSKSLGRVGFSFRVPGETYNLRYLYTEDEVTGLELISADKDVEEIVIQEGVTSIGEYAFSNCSSLESIKIPEGTTSIGRCAFENCSSLTSCMIPAGLTILGGEVFSGCSSLESISIPEGTTSIGEYAFSNCNSLTSCMIPDGLTTLANGVFSGCSSMTDIALPVGLTSIGESAFSDCSNLASITIPDSVTSIGEYAFANCNSLTSCMIPAGLTTLANGVFCDCSSLTDIVLPVGLTSIGDYAFFDCSNLTELTLPSGITYIGEYGLGDDHKTIYTDIDTLTAKSLSRAGYSFRTPGSNYSLKYLYPDNGSMDLELLYVDDNVKSFIIPDFVTSIGNNAFDGCSNLSSITIPDGITNIGEWAFTYCNGLTGIAIPGSVKSIGYAAFFSCRNLTVVSISNGVRDIGERAFDNCWNLTSITIPDSVMSIGWGAFMNCQKLTSISIPESVASIGVNAFSGDVLLEKVFFAGLNTEIGADAFENIAGNAAFYCYEASDAAIYADEHGFDKVLLDGNALSGLYNITIPDSITISSGSAAFIPYTLFPMENDAGILWESSDTDVVKVSEGILTPVSLGRATVRVNWKGKTAECSVTVVPSVSEIILPDPYYFVVRQTVDISIQYYPSDAFAEPVWSISDIKIARVDDWDKKIKGVKIGSTELTVTDLLTGVSKTVELIVCHPVTSVQFENSEYLVAVGREIQLQANVSMRNMSCINQLVSFSSDHPEIAAVDEVTGVVSGISSGTATITAKASNGISAVCTVEVSDPEGDNKMKIPAGTKEIGEEAFYGTAAKVYVIPEGTISIGTKAFGGLKKAALIVIPASVLEFADDAFAGSEVTIIAPAGSEAAGWADSHGISWISP